MMAGFSLGPVFLWEADRRRRFLLRLGAAATGLFPYSARSIIMAIPRRGRRKEECAVHGLVIYKRHQTTAIPGLPADDAGASAHLLLSLLDGVEFRRLVPVVILGRAPLFYYVLHVTLMHLVAVAVCYWQFGAVYWVFQSNSIADFPAIRPPGWGFSLPVVYLIWVAIVAMMYPLCRWFAGVKRRGGSAWLSYM